MSSLEYTHWLELGGLEPVGPERGDWQSAQVVAALANVHRDPKTSPFPHRVQDFLLWEEPEEPDEDAVAARLREAFPDSDEDDA